MKNGPGNNDDPAISLQPLFSLDPFRLTALRPALSLRFALIGET